uniref:Uncharacterized protein n=1 Tax=Lotus japonicus TaxID=34305 RepID=I3SHY3_LOTJA|nr:unknown [Lotus japonicus]
MRHLVQKKSSDYFSHIGKEDFQNNRNKKQKGSLYWRNLFLYFLSITVLIIGEALYSIPRSPTGIFINLVSASSPLCAYYSLQKMVIGSKLYVVTFEYL